jgi:DNA polymerase lambda
VQELRSSRLNWRNLEDRVYQILNLAPLIIADEKFDYQKLLRILKIESISDDVEIVNSLWLSSCLGDRKYTATANYKIAKPTKLEHESKETETLQPSAKSERTESPKAASSSVIKTSDIEPAAVKRPRNDSSDYETDSDHASEEVQISQKKIPVSST